jgi:hypothetical protein
MYRTSHQKYDKRYDPVDTHRKKIGEFNIRTQESFRRSEPSKLSESELKDGTYLLKVLLAIVLLCMGFLGVSLLI